MRGRHSEFTQEIADKICEQLALGRSLRSICKDKGMYTVTSVQKWLNQYPGFAEQYARAREAQAHYLVDEIIEIADNAQDANLGRLQVDARKWFASKVVPKKYGDAIRHEGELSIHHGLAERLATATARIEKMNPEDDESA